MRLTLTLPAALVVKLQQVADAEHRPPRYQAEVMLWDAITQAHNVLKILHGPPAVPPGSDLGAPSPDAEEGSP